MSLPRAPGPIQRCLPDWAAQRRLSAADRCASSIASLTTDPPPAADPGLASRALALDAALTAADGATLPLRPTETALLRDWLHRLAR